MNYALVDVKIVTQYFFHCPLYIVKYKILPSDASRICGVDLNLLLHSRANFGSARNK